MTLPDIQIRQLTRHDLKTFQKLILLFQDVFEEDRQDLPDPDYLTSLLARPDFQVFVVTQKQHLLGGVTAYELRKYTAQVSELYIYDLAIRAEFQRHGLGKQLIRSLREHNQRKGITEMFVAAHAEDRGAVDFYEAIGGETEAVMHFSFDEDAPIH